MVALRRQQLPLLPPLRWNGRSLRQLVPGHRGLPVLPESWQVQLQARQPVQAGLPQGPDPGAQRPDPALVVQQLLLLPPLLPTLPPLPSLAKPSEAAAQPCTSWPCLPADSVMWLLCGLLLHCHCCCQLWRQSHASSACWLHVAGRRRGARVMQPQQLAFK